MVDKFTKNDLEQFTKEIIKKYKKGETYAPVHLSGGNEEELIEIFKHIKPQDWVFTTHRSHYHALLKSKDKEWVINEIINKARSSHINSKKHKIFSSAIVGGVIPIALGVAFALKRKKAKNKVWCFVGDMAAEMGQMWEALKYAKFNNLPIVYVVEDNKIGCNTPTKKAWGSSQKYLENRHLIHYTYQRKYPHYGIGEWIVFSDKKTKGVGDYNG